MIATTRDQDAAVEYVSEHYGSARVDADDHEEGVVKVTGLDADGVERCRWFVWPGGGVYMAWDPDYLLDTFVLKRRADGWRP